MDKDKGKELNFLKDDYRPIAESCRSKRALQKFGSHGFYTERLGSGHLALRHMSISGMEINFAPLTSIGRRWPQNIDYEVLYQEEYGGLCV